MFSSHEVVELCEVFAVCLAFGVFGVPVVMRQYRLHWTFAAIALGVVVVVGGTIGGSIQTFGAVIVAAAGLPASLRQQLRKPLESPVTPAAVVRRSGPLGAVFAGAILPAFTGLAVLHSTAWTCVMVPVAGLAWWTGMRPVDYRDGDLATDLPPFQSLLQILAVLASILQEAWRERRGTLILAVGLVAFVDHYTSVSLVWLAVSSATLVAAWWFGAQSSWRR